MGSTWELGTNSDIQTPLQTYRIKIYILTNPPTHMKLEKQCSKQLAKSEGLFLFVCFKTALEPRMIFYIFEGFLKKKKFSRETGTLYKKTKNKQKKVCQSLCSTARL